MSTIQPTTGLLELSERDRRRIADRMAATGTTQAWLAERLGTYQPWISDLLAGRRLARPHVWEVICREIGLELRLSVAVVAPRGNRKASAKPSKRP